MAAHPLPSAPEPPRRPGPSGGDGGRDLDLYRLAVEEYRFQAEFNWRRTQYLLALNVAVAALGVALAGMSGAAAAPIFGLGVAACALCALVTRQQHDYYRAARDRMRRIEADLVLPEGWRVDTTSSLGARSRWVSVTRLVYVLVASIALVDALSLILAIA